MNLKLISCSAAVALVVVSCFDDNYDLSDIDTTSRVIVDNLVIPANVDDILFSDVIDLDEDSPVKEVTINGVKCYAVSRSGDFDSDPIHINEVTATAPALPSWSFPLGSPEAATLALSDGITFNLQKMENPFTYTCAGVDKAIVELTSAKVNDLEFTALLKTPGLSADNFEAVYYSDLKFQLPLGLDGNPNYGTYDAKTGVWFIEKLPVTGTETKVVFIVSGISFDTDDSSLENNTFIFDSRFNIEGGSLTVKPKESGFTIPSYVEFSADFSLTTLEITSFSGVINYELEGLDVPAVNLNDLPDFLKGDKTNITLVNPLICLQTNNPVPVNFAAALSLTANRDGAPSQTYTSSEFTVGHDRGNAEYNTILSPEKPSVDAIPENFRNNFNWFEYSGLGSILATDENATVKGLPSSIGITLENPRIPTQQINDFALGGDLYIKGSYELFAPLALGVGSTIVYTDTQDGWNDDTIDKLTINKLSIKADAANNTPVSVLLDVYPLDVNGNRIPGL